MMRVGMQSISYRFRIMGQGRTVGCELLPSRYDKVIEALGGHGEFVEHPDMISPRQLSGHWHRDCLRASTSLSKV